MGYLFVDFDPDSALGDIPDATGAAMVKLVGHTLVDRSVYLDVDIIADFEDPEVGGEMGRTFLPEGAGEGISGARPQTVTRRHFAISLRNEMQFESTY